MKISTFNPNLVYNLSGNEERPKYPNDRPRRTIFRTSQFLTYFGLIVSSILVIRHYFAFRVFTKVDISIYKETGLPSIGVCFFYDIEHQHGPILQETADNHKITRLTVKQINDLLPTWDQFVTSCKVAVPELLTYMSCTRLDTNMSEYLNLYSKCFRLFASPLNQIKYNMYHDWASELIKIEINKSILTTSKIGLFLNNPISGLQNAMGDPSFIQLETTGNNLASVTFRRVQIISKPYPYETGCIDYSQLDCRERKMCIHKCVGDTQLAIKKQWNYLRYIKLQPNHFNARFSDYPESSLFSTYCYQKYPHQPCNQLFYIPDLATQINSPFAGNESFKISIIYPYGTEKLIEYYPVESFKSFIIHLTSVIGIWITLPVIKVLNLLFYWTHRAFNWQQNVKTKPKSSHLFLYKGWLTRDPKRQTIRTRHQLSYVNGLSTRNFQRLTW
uniref:Uncharacterized protein n=1 Tax=Tetranychus urticae TaxID=32264 RepID=T1KK83_TETUR